MNEKKRRGFLNSPARTHLLLWIYFLLLSLFPQAPSIKRPWIWSPAAMASNPSLITWKHIHCCCCWVTSVVSGSVRPQRRQPTRMLCSWDSPGKNTGVGCHFLLQCMEVKSESGVAQSCPTLSDSMDCSLPGSSIHGIFQARVLEWGAIAFSKHIHYHM